MGGGGGWRGAGVEVPTQVSTQTAVLIKEEKDHLKGRTIPYIVPLLVTTVSTNAVLKLLQALVETTLPIT